MSRAATAITGSPTRIDGGCRTLLAVSLKMYLDPEATLLWTDQIAELARTHPALTSGEVGLIVLPSLPSLPAVVGALAGTSVEVGAQDLFWEDRGAYTGAVSGTDLRQIGCRYVEIGHVERRRIFGEDETAVRSKVRAAVRNGLVPVLCVGEDDEGRPEDAVEECVRQLASALEDTTAATRLVVAYEPSWAIGRREPAGVDYVVAVTGTLQTWLAGRTQLSGSRLIYGGSAGPGLLPRLQGAADGLFLGRFAHDAKRVAAILDEALELS